MGMLDNFRNKEFLDQITILNEISGSKAPDSLSGLLDLLKTPVGDTSIDYMVVNALNAVLSNNEDKVIEGLNDSHDGYKILCIRVAGEHAIQRAAEPLVRLAETETDLDRLMEILTSLARIADDCALPTFRKFLSHEDAFIQSSCIEALGKMEDAESLEYFKDMVVESEAPDRFEVCDITTWKAVDALASYGSDDTIAFLVEKLHHKNPTVRRIITDALISIGSRCIPMLLSTFENGDIDSRILTANVLGFLRDKQGADGLVAAFDKGLADDENVRYAVYEALGRIGTMKGIICLVDGLHESEELILMAVIGGLEKHVNPGMISAMTKMIIQADDQADRLAKGVIFSRATAIFDALYETQGAADALMDALVESKDPEIIEEFRQVLAEIGGSRAEEDLKRLPQVSTSSRKALAADDSRSMCAMHRAILTDIGFEPFMATNGEEAYDFIEQGEDFEIIITDMNMPVMDGMELVSKVRSTPGMEDIPIIMVTTESEGSQQDLARKAVSRLLLPSPSNRTTSRRKSPKLQNKKKGLARGLFSWGFESYREKASFLFFRTLLLQKINSHTRDFVGIEHPDVPHGGTHTFPPTRASGTQHTERENVIVRQCVNGKTRTIRVRRVLHSLGDIPAGNEIARHFVAAEPPQITPLMRRTKGHDCGDTITIRRIPGGTTAHQSAQAVPYKDDPSVRGSTENFIHRHFHPGHGGIEILGKAIILVRMQISESSRPQPTLEQNPCRLVMIQTVNHENRRSCPGRSSAVWQQPSNHVGRTMQSAATAVINPVPTARPRSSTPARISVNCPAMPLDSVKAT